MGTWVKEKVWIEVLEWVKEMGGKGVGVCKEDGSWWCG